MVMSAFAGAATVGWKRIGRWIAVPGAMIRGKWTTSGARNSGDDELTSVTVNGQEPVLTSVNGSSRKEPTHTLPNSPWSAMATANTPVPAAAVTVRSNVGVLGSLLVIRMVPVWGPGAVGVKVMVKSTWAPGARVTGAAGSDSTRKGPALGNAITWSTIRSSAPTLKISRASDEAPHTVPKRPPFSMSTAMAGSAAAIVTATGSDGIPLATTTS